MTDYVLEDVSEEMLIAFNFQEDTELDSFSATKHDFDNAHSFPKLSEWSRYSAHNDDLTFQGIAFKHNNDSKPYVTIRMNGSQTGFKNIFGKYIVDEQGFMHSANILAHNTRNTGDGDKVSFLHTDAASDLQFFLIANGYSYNKDIDVDNGHVEFVYAAGTDQERVAKITDDPSKIDLIFKSDEQDVKLTGPTYHTSNAQLNFDGKPHSIAGLMNDNNANMLRVGFEDFPNLGDGDFNDLIFDVEISYIPSDSVIAHSLESIEPASGNDEVLYKDGYDEDNDIFLGNGATPNSQFDFNYFEDLFIKVDADGLEEDNSSERDLDLLAIVEESFEIIDAVDLAISNFVGQESPLILPSNGSENNIFVVDAVSEQDNVMIAVDII